MGPKLKGPKSLRRAKSQAKYYQKQLKMKEERKQQWKEYWKQQKLSKVPVLVTGMTVNNDITDDASDGSDEDLLPARLSQWNDGDVSGRDQHPIAW